MKFILKHFLKHEQKRLKQFMGKLVGYHFNQNDLDLLKIKEATRKSIALVMQRADYWEDECDELIN